MKRPGRTVSKLLDDTYSHLCASEGAYIGECLFDTWNKTHSGENVLCEAFVSLENAARRITKIRRMTFSKLETDRPDTIPSLFRAAIEITEERTPLELDL